MILSPRCPGSSLFIKHASCRSMHPSAGQPKRRRLLSHASADNAAAAATQTAVAAPATLGKNGGSFRWWYDERRFKGAAPMDKCVVQTALFKAGGVRTGGYPKAAPCAGPLGWQRPGDWDMLWSPARLALRAVPHLQPGQLVSAYPGLMGLTRKKQLPATLRATLGDDIAATIMPRSFELPTESANLARHMSAGVANPQELWILKTAQHLGMGLNLLPACEVMTEVAARQAQAGRKNAPKPYALAQQYVDNPMLIDGRKFGIRTWVLVTGHQPLRAYMHTAGLVLFATHGYDSDKFRDSEGGVGLGHVTNYAQNVDGTVWDLQQLAKHMGQGAYDALWDRMARSAALLVSAALPGMRAECEGLGVPTGGCFELLGLDFLVDTDGHPWLLEVNGTPSLAVDHEDPVVEALIRTQKGSMVRDIVSILGLRTRFTPRYRAMATLAKLQAVTGAKGTSGGKARVLGRKRVKASGKAVVASGTQGEEDSGDWEEVGDGDVDMATGEAGQVGSAATARAPSTAGGAKRRAGLLVGGRVRSAASSTPSAAAGKGGEEVEEEQEVGPGAAASSASRTELPAHLRELLWPTSGEAAMARVVQELRSRGGFEPLMPLFPISAQQVADAGTPPKAMLAALSPSHASPAPAQKTDVSGKAEGGPYGSPAAGGTYTSAPASVDALTSPAAGSTLHATAGAGTQITWGALDLSLRRMWSSVMHVANAQQTKHEQQDAVGKA